MSRSKQPRKETKIELRKSESHEMGLQIPRGVYPEIPPEGAVWRIASPHGRIVSRVGPAKGLPDRGGASDGRSRSYAVEHSAEVFGVAGGRVPQRQECDPYGEDVFRTEKELCVAAFLGARLHGVDGRQG